LSTSHSRVEALFRHGGDVVAASAAFPEAPSPWIDLSTGVNPVPYPLPELPGHSWARLPPPGELDTLLVTAARRYGVRPESVAAAPGAQSLLQALPRLYPVRRVAVLGPTYEEHERTWRKAGAAVEIVGDLDAARHAEVVVLVNPNNPDGRLLTRRELLDFARANPGRLLIVDEAFMDLADESIAPFAPPSTIVLRSFGKIFGLAGVRLGFALTDAARAAEIRTALGPWCVSGPAIEIGRRALSDDHWLERTKARLVEDGRWLDAALSQAGFVSVGGTLLFRLVRRPDAPRLFRKLCAAGILTRPFAASPEWLRFGIPRAEDRARLGEALLKVT
jgi:cobalamin biosynthetic protein CobC